MNVRRKIRPCKGKKKKDFDTSILTDVRKGQDEIMPVVRYHTPDDLYKAMDFNLPLTGAGVEGKKNKK